MQTTCLGSSSGFNRTCFSVPIFRHGYTKTRHKCIHADARKMTSRKIYSICIFFLFRLWIGFSKLPMGLQPFIFCWYYQVIWASLYKISTRNWDLKGCRLVGRLVCIDLKFILNEIPLRICWYSCLSKMDEDDHGILGQCKAQKIDSM